MKVAEMLLLPQRLAGAAQLMAFVDGCY